MTYCSSVLEFPLNIILGINNIRSFETSMEISTIPFSDYDLYT